MQKKHNQKKVLFFISRYIKGFLLKNGEFFEGFQESRLQGVAFAPHGRSLL